MQHKPREEVGERPHVAVDPLDELARRVGMMEFEIQSQAVGGEIGTQGVGGRPADILPHGGRSDGEDVGDERDAEEEPRGERQALQRAARPRGVDEVAEDLRVDQLEADAPEQGEGQAEHFRPLGAEIAAQQRPVAEQWHRPVLSHPRGRQPMHERQRPRGAIPRPSDLPRTGATRA